jgi:hypothetical protein
MRSFFSVGFQYFIWTLRGDVNGSSDVALAGGCLKEKPSLRFPASAANDSLLVLKCWLKTLRATMNFSGSVHYEYKDGKKGAAVFDHKSAVREIRVSNLRANAGFAPQFTIARHDLRSKSFTRFFEFLLLSVFMLPWALVRGSSSRNRVNTALLWLEMAEAHALLQWLSRHDIRELYFYSPFEKDANALYLLIKELNIEVYKIPSPNLLSIHNKILLSDVLVLSSPYQQDEMDVFHATIRAGRVLHWKPEQFDGYAHIYHSETPQPKPGTLGYYSHASWVRHADDDTNTGIGDHESEVLLKKIMGSYLSLRQDLKVTVFLHPREKKHRNFTEVVSHYDRVFGTGRYEFAPLASPGSHLFYTVDVGVGAISTILFERLFLGYKTIFFPAAMTAFPLPDSKIKMICPTSEAAFHKALDLALSLPSESYFAQTGLGQYTISQW